MFIERYSKVWNVRRKRAPSPRSSPRCWPKGPIDSLHRGRRRRTNLRLMRCGPHRQHRRRRTRCARGKRSVPCDHRSPATPRRSISTSTGGSLGSASMATPTRRAARSSRGVVSASIGCARAAVAARGDCEAQRCGCSAAMSDSVPMHRDGGGSAGAHMAASRCCAARP